MIIYQYERLQLFYIFTYHSKILRGVKKVLYVQIYSI